MKRLALLLALLPSVAQAQTATEFYLKYSVSPSGAVTITAYVPPPVPAPLPFTAGWIEIIPNATTYATVPGATWRICRRTDGGQGFLHIPSTASPTCAPRVP